METCETKASSKHNHDLSRGKFRHATRKSFAYAASTYESKANINSISQYSKLCGQVSNTNENQGSEERGSYSNQFSSTSSYTCDISKTAWPELPKCSFQRHGNRLKLSKIVSTEQHILEGGPLPGNMIKKCEGTDRNTSTFNINDSLLVVQANTSDKPLQVTSYSCKTKGNSSVEFDNCATILELKKSCRKSTHQFHISSVMKPHASAGIHNYTNEVKMPSNCVIGSGVVCEEQICDNHMAPVQKCKIFSGVALNAKVELDDENFQKAKELPQSQSKEENTVGEIVKESKNTPLDERKFNQRRKIWKEEKKRVREEEARRRMLAPKGQRVRLVSQKMLDALLNSNSNMSFSIHQNAAPTMNEMEFPTLEELKKQRMTVNEELSTDVQSGTILKARQSAEVQEKLKDLGGNSKCVKSSSAAEEVMPVNSMTAKSRKRKDPIQIDLLNLIKTRSSRHKKGERANRKLSSRVQKRDNLVRYCGNQLDASNPERMRGKRKEEPRKKKITVLKSAILQERALRRHLRALKEQAETSDTQFLSLQNRDQNSYNIENNRNINIEVMGDCRMKEIAQGTLLSRTEEIQNILCVTKEMPFVEVTDDNIKKVNKDVLDLTQKLQERLCLSTNARADTCSSRVSVVSENIQEVIHKTETEEDNCNLVLSGYTDMSRRLPIHSRKFREYCDNFLSAPLNNAIKQLLKDVVKFQDRQYQRDPVKAFAKRRYVSGFREVKKYLHLKKLKLIIIAPDLEVAKTKGGIDDIVAQLKEEATAQGVTYLFALSRRELGFLSFKKVGISSIGICNYEGSEGNFEKVVENLAEARAHYEQESQCTVKNVPQQPNVNAVHEPDDIRDETSTVTDEVIASLLSKLTGKSSESVTPVFLSVIEQRASLETQE